VSTFFEGFAIFAIVVFVFGLICQIKIITKAGYSGWYVLTAFVPFLNIVMFLIFTFGKWPIQARLEAAERGGSRGYSPPPFGQPVVSPVPRPGSGGPPPPIATGLPQPQSQPQPQPPQQSVIYCSWCGKERAVDAQAIHHCGSMDRPPVYCMSCGTPLVDGAPNCTSCGTPATQLSR
jgi:hypothetical protein